MKGSCRYRVFQYYGCSDESPQYYAIPEQSMNDMFASLLLSLHSARADAHERIEYRLYAYMLVRAECREEAITIARKYIEKQYKRGEKLFYGSAGLVQCE